MRLLLRDSAGEAFPFGRRTVSLHGLRAVLPRGQDPVQLLEIARRIAAAAAAAADGS